MAAPYLDDLRKLLEALPDVAAAGVECRHFFSGAAAYVGGKIFISLSPAGLALKLPEEQRRRLFDAGGSALQYFPNLPVKKDYVVLPGDIAADMAALGPLAAEAIKHAGGRK